jgi:photosystem II stability/assembly factor-like uncharacterized protein
MSLRHLNGMVRLLAIWAVASAFAVPVDDASGQVVYMSILSTRAHQWNRNDYPMIGLFASTDCGGTWQHLGWREYIRMFHTIEASDGTLWSACGNGVLRSVDGGASWKITTGWEITEVTRMSADPRQPDHVFAATAYGPIRSTDHGESWRFITDGLDRPFASEVCIDRTNGSHLLLAAETGIFSSADAGSHWRRVALKGCAIRTIIQDPGTDSRFWVGTEDQGIWSSTDAGETWHSCNNGLAHRTVYALTIGGTGNGLMFAGTQDGGVYRSTNAGNDWRQCSTGLKDPSVHALAIAGGAQPILFAASMNDGLFTSKNLGDTWEFNSQPEAEVWGLSIGPGKGGRAR